MLCGHLTVYLFINYGKFYRKQYPLPAVSRLASRGEQWLHVCNIYTDRSQEILEKKSSEINKQINKNKFNLIKFTIMDIANIRSRVFRKFLLLSRVNQYNHFLLKVFGVKCRGH